MLAIYSVQEDTPLTDYIIISIHPYLYRKRIKHTAFNNKTTITISAEEGEEDRRGVIVAVVWNNCRMKKLHYLKHGVKLFFHYVSGIVLADIITSLHLTHAQIHAEKNCIL